MLTPTVPVLIGTSGIIDGEVFLLDRNTTVTIGRSRSCDISLRRTKTYRNMSAAERADDHDFNTVSRQHLRISIEDGGEVTLLDMSSNGTFCNDRLLQGPTRIALSANGHSLRLGTRETVILSLTTGDDPRIQGLTPLKPGQVDPSAATPQPVSHSH